MFCFVILNQSYLWTSKRICQNLQVVKHEEGSFSSCQHDSKPSNGQPCCVYGGESCRMCRYIDMNTTRIKFHIFPLLYFRLSFLPFSCSMEIDNLLLEKALKRLQGMLYRKSSIFLRYSNFCTFPFPFL